MADVQQILRKNFRIHLADGALYVASGALLSPQTVFPALLSRLGADNVFIGLLPVTVYAGYFLPQVFAANHAMRHAFRKPWVLTLGVIQRMHIALLALAVAFVPAPFLMPLFFVLFLSNQIAAGLTSPAWYDFYAKTVALDRRGILLGLRASGGAALGFLNGLLMTVLLVSLRFPDNYASVIGLGFLFQLSSVVVQRHVQEWEPSPVVAPSPPRLLWVRLRAILRRDRAFVRFLLASSMMVLAFSGVGFLTVAALRTFRLSESAVGLFTVLTIGAQVLSGAFIGWVADRRGNKTASLLTSGSLFAALAAATLARSAEWYWVVFVFAGVHLGADLSVRYNFAAEFAAPADRTLYVGLMNAWLAPFYLGSLGAGYLSDRVGYPWLFGICSCAGAAAMAMFAAMPNPRARRLALSSK